MAGQGKYTGVLMMIKGVGSVKQGKYAGIIEWLGLAGQGKCIGLIEWLGLAGQRFGLVGLLKGLSMMDGR